MINVVVFYRNTAILFLKYIKIPDVRVCNTVKLKERIIMSYTICVFYINRIVHLNIK